MAAEVVVDVTIVQAQGFEGIKSPSPTVTVFCGNTMAFKTAKKKGTTPVWNENGRLVAKDGEPVTFRVYQHYRFKKNVLLGVHELDVAGLAHEQIDVWVDIHNVDANGRQQQICSLNLRLALADIESVVVNPEAPSTVNVAAMFSPSPEKEDDKALTSSQRTVDTSEPVVPLTLSSRTNVHGNGPSPEDGPETDEDLSLDDEFDSSDEYGMGLADHDHVAQDVRRRRSPYIEYASLVPTEMCKVQLRDMSEVAEIFEIPPGIARQLLQKFDWDRLKLIEQYYETSPDAFYKQMKIADPNASGASVFKLDPAGESECAICCCDVPNNEAAALACKHVFCRDCLNDYLKVEVMGKGSATNIRCPLHGCGKLFDEVMVADLLTDEAALQQYTKLLAAAFVEGNPRIRWCPGRGCDNAVKVELLKAHKVSCQCGTSFCFMCGEPAHVPATCQNVKDWKAKLNDGTEDDHWLILNTKVCPNSKCAVPINKDEGCQFMSCPRCNFKFCWMCMKESDHKRHACNTFEESPEQTDARNALNKFNHFSTRYGTHAQSPAFQQALLNRIDEWRQANQRAIPLLASQYLADAAAQLIEARGVLRDSYTFGYYIDKSFNLDLFEHVQAELEIATEALSEAVESKDDDVLSDKAKIATLSANVATRLLNFIEGIEGGHLDAGDLQQKDKIYEGDQTVGYSGWLYTPAE